MLHAAVSLNIENSNIAGAYHQGVDEVPPLRPPFQLKRPIFRNPRNESAEKRGKRRVLRK